MHESMSRLYEAARLLKNIEGPSAVASLLGISPQLVNNWERRGVSTKGMLTAQERIGCSATWLQTGELPMAVRGNASAKHAQSASDSPKSERKSTVIETSGASAGGKVNPAPRTMQQRLRAALGEKVTASELASVARVSAETAGLWLSGAGPEITLEQAVPIQETYGLNAVWLLKEKGKPGVEIRYADDWNPIPVTNWRPIPVVGMAQLGDNGFWADIEYEVGVGDGFVDVPSKDKDAYALKCKGDSMKPRIKDGEFVVVEPNHPIEPGDEVLVKSKDGRVMVKEFIYEAQGKVHLLSVNEAHGKMSIDRDNIEKMHYVGWIAKRSAWRPAT